MASALEETFMLKMFLKMLFEPQPNVKDAQDKLDMPMQSSQIAKPSTT